MPSPWASRWWWTVGTSGIAESRQGPPDGYYAVLHQQHTQAANPSLFVKLPTIR